MARKFTQWVPGACVLSNIKANQLRIMPEHLVIPDFPETEKGLRFVELMDEIIDRIMNGHPQMDMFDDGNF